jgi:uncharacterized Zn-finger protein
MVSGIKKLFCVTLSMALIAGGCGTGTEKAMQHMEEKYGKEFSPISYDHAAILSTTDTVECYTEDMDPDHERVFVDLEVVSGEIVYHDSYFGYLVREEMENQIHDVIRKEFKECKVYRDNINSVLPDDLTPENDMEDFYKADPSYRMCVKVYVKDEASMTQADFDDRMHGIEKELLALGKRYTLCLVVLPEDVYNDVNRYSQDEILLNKDSDIYSYEATISNGEVRNYGTVQ